MRRPDIELSDDAALYVEQHPEVIARLAGQAHGDSEPAAASAEQRARFRQLVRAKLAFAGTSEATAAGVAFLAKYANRAG
jgi:hypothetical protein